MKDLRISALIGAVLGLVVFGGLAGIAFYDGVKSTAKVTAPVLVSNPAKMAEKPPLRKSDKLDQRQVRPLPLGRVLSWDQSSVI